MGKIIKLQDRFTREIIFGKESEDVPYTILDAFQTIVATDDADLRDLCAMLAIMDGVRLKPGESALYSWVSERTDKIWSSLCTLGDRTSDNQDKEDREKEAEDETKH
jgi:hypothetical protein